MKRYRKRSRNIAIKAADDAPNQEKLYRLLDACRLTKKPILFEAGVRFLGILGLREGELAHLHKKWIDFGYKMINIPLHDPCDCSKCKYSYRSKLKCKGIDKKEISDEEVRKHYWQPKKQHSRKVPFGFDPETEAFLKGFFDKYEKFPKSQKVIWDMIKLLGRLTGIEPIYPHALRATAAIKFARDGLNAYQLMEIMGWTDLETSQHYVKLSGQDVIDAIEKLYSRKNNDIIWSKNFRTYFLNQCGRQLMRRKPYENEEKLFENLLISTMEKSHRFKLP